MNVSAEIRKALEQAFDAHLIEITDESEAHRGHAGYRKGGQSHFRVKITAPEFARQTRLQRHRAVYAALGPELTGRIHALSLELHA